MSSRVDLGGGLCNDWAMWMGTIGSVLLPQIESLPIFHPGHLKSEQGDAEAAGIGSSA